VDGSLAIEVDEGAKGVVPRLVVTDPMVAPTPIPSANVTAATPALCLRDSSPFIRNIILI
jgi:hypothetical protein